MSDDFFTPITIHVLPIMVGYLMKDCAGSVFAFPDSDITMGLAVI